jgi:hypothetical protein
MVIFVWLVLMESIQYKNSYRVSRIEYCIMKAKAKSVSRESYLENAIGVKKEISI